MNHPYSEPPWWPRPGGSPSAGMPAHQPFPVPPSPRGDRRWHVLWAVLALVAAAAVMLAAALAYSRATADKELDVLQAEDGVRQILSDPANGYGANDVTSVRCNRGDNPRVVAGASFTCTVDMNGTTRTVDVVFTDGDGTYAVGGPR